MRRGWGCQGGYDYGFRRFISPKNELAALEYQEKMLEEELTAIKEEKAVLQAQENKRRHGGPFVKKSGGLLSIRNLSYNIERIKFMPRPRLCRKIDFNPNVTYFKLKVSP